MKTQRTREEIEKLGMSGRHDSMNRGTNDTVVFSHLPLILEVLLDIREALTKEECKHEYYGATGYDGKKYIICRKCGELKSTEKEEVKEHTHTRHCLTCLDWKPSEIEEIGGHTYCKDTGKDLCCQPLKIEDCPGCAAEKAKGEKMNRDFHNCGKEEAPELPYDLAFSSSTSSGSSEYEKTLAVNHILAFLRHYEPYLKALTEKK